MLESLGGAMKTYIKHIVQSEVFQLIKQWIEEDKMKY